MVRFNAAVAAFGLLLACSAGEAFGQGWIDLLAGDPVADARLLSDLQNARIVYVGEAHTAPSHHRLEEQLFQSLSAGNAPLSLFLEALESKDAPALSRFLGGGLSFEQFAREIDWAKRWSNYRDYRNLCLAAREKHVPIFGLDGPAPLFHQIARRGWGSLSSRERQRLGLNPVRFNPVYQRLLRLFLPIHPGMGRTWQTRAAEAQEVRDDWMARCIVQALLNGPHRRDHALVICGAGHLRFGLGLPDHVSARLPLPRRILLLALPAERPATAESAPDRRPPSILPLSHAAFEFVDRPLGDYLWLPPKSLPAHAAKDRPESP